MPFCIRFPSRNMAASVDRSHNCQRPEITHVDQGKMLHRVSRQVCVCLSVSVCVYVCKCLGTYVYMQGCVCVGMYVWMYLSIALCSCICCWDFLANSCMLCGSQAIEIGGIESSAKRRMALAQRWDEMRWDVRIGPCLIRLTWSYIYIYIHTHTHTHIHTHTHTHTHSALASPYRSRHWKCPSCGTDHSYFPGQIFHNLPKSTVSKQHSAAAGGRSRRSSLTNKREEGKDGFSLLRDRSGTSLSLKFGVALCMFLLSFLLLNSMALSALFWWCWSILPMLMLAQTMNDNSNTSKLIKSIKRNKKCM